MSINAFAFLRSDVEGGKGGDDDRVRGFLTERNYLGALTLLVNAIKEEERGGG